MECEKIADEALAADRMDVLYGEADAAVRARFDAHLAACPACREEMAALRAVRRQLQAWRRDGARPGFAPRGLALPRWLAAAALVVLGLGATLGVSGYLSLRRALAAQEARAALVEQQQREATRTLATALTRPVVPLADAATLASLDARIDARIRASEALRGERLERRLADWEERARVQRRVDMAQVAASLSYLDGRHGEQLARTNELMGYFLEASQKR